MRKKALIAQNLELFEQLEKLHAEISAKDKKIEELKDEISELKQKSAEKKAEPTLPLKKLEEKVISNSRLNPDVDYASDVIGELVLEAASGSNKLTANGDNSNRELVNLILGKTEVAKAEILSVVSEDTDFESKKQKIEVIKAETLDYFKSILAQLG